MEKRNKNTVATRKVKAGMRDMVDPKTGEIKKVQHYEIKDVDINWNKIWLGHLLDALEMVGNKKMLVVSWLLENRDKKTNEVIATQQEVMQSTGLSKKTISETFKVLQEAEVLSKIRNGRWQLSPNFIWQGDGDERMDILLTYNNQKSTNNNQGENE